MVFVYQIADSSFVSNGTTMRRQMSALHAAVVTSDKMTLARLIDGELGIIFLVATI